MNSTLRFSSKPKKNMTSTLPASLARNSPNHTRSPNNNMNKNNSRINSKKEKIDSSVSYLQQVFIQRKQEE